MNRNDIVGLMTAATSGAALLNSTTALSANKYSVAVIKAREVVSLNASYKADRLPESMDRMASKLDRLLGFLLTQFKSETSTEEVRDVMRNSGGLNALDESELGTLPDSVVPIALMRELLSKHRIMIDFRKLGHWDEFASRYQMSVLLA
jgi:hypothetical protein